MSPDKEDVERTNDETRALATPADDDRAEATRAELEELRARSRAALERLRAIKV